MNTENLSEEFKEVLPSFVTGDPAASISSPRVCA